MDSALQDAVKALKIDSQWPKGHFRKAKAFVGLKVSQYICIDNTVHTTVTTVTILMCTCRCMKRQKRVLRKPLSMIQIIRTPKKS